MFRFENPQHFWLFGLVLVFLLGAWWFSKNQQAQIDKLASKNLQGRLLSGFSLQRNIWKNSLLIASLALLVIALVNPQWSGKREKVTKESSEIFILLDISTSMQAQDIKPNRLEKAKQFTVDLIEQLKGEKLGLILFAGNAYLQMPLTTDYAATQLFVKSADPGLAGSQGTAIGEAINMATTQLTKTEAGGSKGIIVITDGEDHTEEAIQTAKNAKDKGIITYLVGVGTEEGARIPTLMRGRLAYKRDNSGATITSKLNVDMLRELAEAGKGSSYLLSTNYASILDDLVSSLNKLDKRELEQFSFKQFESYYQYFLFPSLLFLLWELFLPVRKRISTDTGAKQK